MERDEGVHLEALEENLDHDEPRRLEQDGEDLAHEAKELKLDFSIGGEAAAKGNHSDDGRELAVGLLEPGRERDEEDGDRGKGLEHLDE